MVGERHLERRRRAVQRLRGQPSLSVIEIVEHRPRVDASQRLAQLGEDGFGLISPVVAREVVEVVAQLLLHSCQAIGSDEPGSEDLVRPTFGHAT
jgi:hypothetical protein